MGAVVWALSAEFDTQTHYKVRSIVFERCIFGPGNNFRISDVIFDGILDGTTMSLY